MINKLHAEMIKLYAGDPKRIQHFCKVHSYACANNFLTIMKNYLFRITIRTIPDR